MNRLKVVFIGGLTNGKIVYDYLRNNKYVELVAAITYPNDYQGARHAVLSECLNMYRTGTVKDAEAMINIKRPDLIVVAGWSELIPPSILKIPRMGTIGFHPAKLPFDRGRSVLAWQIEDGYTETALTMFQYTEYPDGGDILAQEPIKIDKEDYINDVLDKVDKATYNILKAYFPLLRQNLLEVKRQDVSEGTFRRLRNQLDSQINWNANSNDIYNKVRAISHPYPGAETTLNDKRIRVWRCKVVDHFYAPIGTMEPSTVVATFYDGTMMVKSRDSFIHITDFEYL
jgi:methionyl-tRNA formyltransferase